MPVNKITMKVSVVVSLLALIKEGVAECDSSSAIVRGRCYEKEVLVENVYQNRDLVVDFHTNVLYFTNRTEFTLPSSSCYLDLYTKELGVISQVRYGRAHAVDQVGHKVYIAGSRGIYRFHYNNKTLEHLIDDSIDTMSMFYKDVLYCLSLENRLYMYKDGAYAEVQDMEGINVDAFVVDRDGYYFFGNNSGVFGKSKVSEKVDIYEKDIYVFPMATDVVGNAYLCYGDRIYLVNKEEKTLETIGILLDNCQNLAFDKDNNIIYTTYHKILRLKLKTSN